MAAMQLVANRAFNDEEAKQFEQRIQQQFGKKKFNKKGEIVEGAVRGGVAILEEELS